MTARSRWAAAGLVGCGYFLAARLGLSFTSELEGMAVVWPAAGVLAAALLLSPRSEWLPLAAAGVAANAAANLSAGNPLPLAAGFAAANGAESLLAAWAVRRFVSPRPRFRSLREVFGFLLVAAVASNALTALLGAAVAALAAGAPYWAAWRVWWVADGVGLLVVAPLLLTLRPGAGEPLPTGARAAEAAALVLALGAAAHWLFSLAPATDTLLSDAPHLLFPFLLWAAVRFGPRGAASANAILTVAAVWHSHHHQGPFEVPGRSEAEHVLAAQVFLALATVCTLALAAATAARRGAERVLRDALRREREQTATLSGVLAAAPVGLAVVDPGFRVRRANGASPSVGCVSGRPPEGVLPGEVLGCLCAGGASGGCGDGPLCKGCALRGLVARVLSTGVAELQREIPFARACAGEGAPVWLLASAVPARLAEGTSVVLAVQDITAQRAREEEIRVARLEAEAAVRTKVEFLANVSHEMRTPLNGVVGMLDLLGDAELGPEEAEYLGLARQSAASLGRAIDEILDVSSLEAGRTAFERIEFDLRGVVEEAVYRGEEAAREKGLAFTCRVGPEVPRSVTGDPRRFGQVLALLVDNAVKFTEAGEVEVSVGLVGGEMPAQGRERLSAVVRDTGVGVPASALGALFRDVGRQGDGSITRRHGGIGLGLAMIGRLVEGMGGVVGVESVPGEGSVFTVVLPCDARSTADAAPPRAAPAADLTDLLTNLDGDRQLLQELVAALLRDLPVRLERIGGAVARGEAAALEREAHGVKGSVATFGAARARNLAVGLEEMGRREDLSEAPEALSALAGEVERLLAELAPLA